MMTAERAWFRRGSKLQTLIERLRQGSSEDRELAITIRDAVDAGYQQLGELYREAVGMSDQEWEAAKRTF